MSEAEDLMDFEEPEEQVEQQAEEKRGGRANERIQQLIEERNQERQARAELEARVKSMEGLKDTVGELLAQRKAQEAAAKVAEQTKPVPDFIEDPVGHVDAKMAKVQAEVARLETLAEEGSKKAAAEAQQAREQLALMQFGQRVQASEAEFMKAHPDYYQALDHARSVRVAEMEYLGMDKAEITKAINTEEVNAAMAAIARGKDPAEFVYKRAVAAGFRGGSTGDSKLDDEVALYEKRKLAQSIGSNQDDGAGLSPQGDAWDAVESAFKELFGEQLR